MLFRDVVGRRLVEIAGIFSEDVVKDEDRTVDAKKKTMIILTLIIIILLIHLLSVKISSSLQNF